MFGHLRRGRTAGTPHASRARHGDRSIGWKRFLAAASIAAIIFATACGTRAMSAPAAASPTAAHEVTVVAQDNARFTPSTLTVEAGRPVRLVLRNEGVVIHDVTLRAGTAGLAEQVRVVAAGGSTASATFTPTAPGTYLFVCSQPGHEAAGMVGTLNVVAAGP